MAIRHRMLGGDLHPFYRAILLRGLENSYALPTSDCQRLQNNLVKKLVTDGVWALLDYLYVYQNTSGANDFGRINWIYPARALSTGTPTYVHKKGIYGSQNNVGFTIASHRVAMTDAQNASMFVLLTVGGSTVSINETIHTISDPANIHHMVRVDTNPRVIGVFNTATGSAFQISSGIPASNIFYHLDMGQIAGITTRSIYVNGVANSVATSPSGVLPNNLYSQTIGVTSTRAVGLVGGGGSICSTANGAKQVLLYNAFNAYNTQLQTLP